MRPGLAVTEMTRLRTSGRCLELILNNYFVMITFKTVLSLLSATGRYLRLPRLIFRAPLLGLLSYTFATTILVSDVGESFQA